MYITRLARHSKDKSQDRSRVNRETVLSLARRPRRNAVHRTCENDPGCRHSQWLAMDRGGQGP